jgi:hypothetical protein
VMMRPRMSASVLHWSRDNVRCRLQAVDARVTDQ